MLNRNTTPSSPPQPPLLPRAHSPRGEIPSTQRRAPQRPPKPCLKAGCNNLTTERNGYCAEHQAFAEEQEKRRNEYRQKQVRENSTRRGYGSAWQKLRAAKLRQNPLCERCGAPATVVHHKDHNQFNDFWDNLEAVCRDCHEEHHGRKRKEQHAERFESRNLANRSLSAVLP